MGWRDGSGASWVVRQEGKGSHAETRRRGGAEGWDRVPQLPKAFWGHEGVLECSGLAELGMGLSASMGKSKAVSSHRSPRKKHPESHAKARRREGLGWVLRWSGILEALTPWGGGR
jgi:hypothetical protein